MKASFQIFTAAAARHAAQSGFVLVAMVAGSVGPTNSAVAQPIERLHVEPISDKHDFINPMKSADAASGTIELERVFWMCDYAATDGALEAREIELCGAVTQQLQRVKFDDDFEKLLAWWRVNKEPQHLALAGAEAIGSCRQGDKK